MAVQLNHKIVWCRDQTRSAGFLTQVLGLPAPIRFGPFLVVTLDNGVSLDFQDYDGDIPKEHYAFLISEEEFDEIYGRIVERGLDHWANPMRTEPGTFNRNDGGRGVYFEDPDGQFLEVLTRPYGSGGWSGYGPDSQSAS